MRKYALLLIALLMLPLAASAQQTFASRQANNNFTGQNTLAGVKIEWSGAVTYQASQIVSYMGSLYQSVAGGNLNHVPTLTMYWTPVSSASGGLPTVTTVSYSATPTFTITGNDVFTMTLAGNITSMTLSGTPATGWREQFRIIQSPDQNKTIVWPASFLQKPSISPDAGSVTIIDVVYNGTNWILENTTRPSYVARYVAVTGNDANDGMTKGTAKLTLIGAAESCIFGTTSQYTQVGGPKTTGSYCNIFFEDNVRANPDGTQYGYWIMGDQDAWALANPAAFAAGTLPTGWRKNSGVMVNLIGTDCIENSTNGTGSTCNVVGGTGQKGFPLIWLSHVGGVSIQNMKGHQAYLAINSDLTRTVVSAAQTVNIALTNNGFGDPGEVTAGAGASPGIDIGGGAFWIWIKRGVTHVPFNFGSIASLVRASGVTTATTSAAHAFIVGDTFTILDAVEDSFNSINGNNSSTSFTVATTADNTHFTFAQAGKPDLTVGAGGTAFNDSQYCVRISNGTGLVYVEDMNCNGGGVGVFGSNSGNIHIKNMTVEGDFARPTTPVLMVQGNMLGAIDITGGGLSDTLTQAHAVVVNEPNNPYNADKVIVQGVNGINLGPFTALSTFGTSSSNTNPFVEGQVGFIRGRAVGVPIDDYHSSPMYVRFPNLIGASGTWTIVNTAPCATAILTSGIADPDGGTNAHHLAATTAECQAAIRFYNTSTSVSTGDLFIVKIRVRGTNLPDGIRGAGADILNISGLDNQPLDLQWETAAFNQGDGDWQTITAVYKLAAITSGSINPDINLSFRTEHPLDFYMPYAAFIESGVISDSEAVNVATTLRPYPSTCTAGQLCAANGVVAGGVPTTITVADTNDTTAYCGLFESATGDLGPKTDAGCTYDATNGKLTVGGIHANTNTSLFDYTNITVPDLNLTGIPGATGEVFSTDQTISRPAGAFGPYGVAAGKSSYMESLSGGSFSASEKTTYAPFHATLVGRAAGQNTAYNTSIAGYGLGDAFGGGGGVACWGGGYVAGTSQPLCGVAEWNVGEGNTTFSALVNGTPGASATSIPYDTEANESVLGQRFLLNLTRATVAGTVASISGTTVTTSSSPNWVGGAAVCNITGAATNCDPTGQYFKVNSSDVTINAVSIGHWYKITAVINTTSFTIENNYDAANLATTGAYTIVQGSDVQSFDTVGKTLTIAANGWTWSNNDSLQSPPNHQVNLRGFNLLFNHLFKTRGATTRDVPFVITANGYPMDYGMFWDGAGGYTVMMEFQATTMGTGFEFGTGLSGEVVYLNSTTAAYLRRAGGGGGTIGLRDTNTINWATGASDTVLSMNATSKNLQISVAGAAAVPIATASDTAYDATTWNANLDAPTKNAVRDKIETMAGAGPGTTTGDTRYCSTTATPCVESRLPIGATGDYYSVVGGIPAWSTPGVVPDQRTTTTEAITCADRGQQVTFANAANIAVSIVSSASCGNNFYFAYKVIGPGKATFTPTTSTIQVNDTAAAATMIALAGQQGSVTGDNTNYLATRTGYATGVTGSINPGVLIAGACGSGTATILGATTAMAAFASPVTYPGDGVVWEAYVTADTVTVKVCAIVGLTPTASVYNTRLAY